MHRRRAIRLTVLALLLLVTSGVATAQFSASSPSSLSEAAQSSLVTVTAYDASGKVIATGGGCFVRDNVVATDYLTIKDAASIKISTSRAEGITGWLFAVDRSRLLALIHPDGTKAPPLLPSDDSGSAGASGGALAVTGIRDGLADLTTVSVALSTDKDSNQFLKVDSGGQELLAGSPVIDSTGRIAGIVTTVAGAHTGCFCAVPAVVLSDLIFQTVNDVASRNDHTASARHFEVVPDVPAGKDSNNVPTGATQTKTIRCVEPVYPALAKAAGIYGSVIVGITIDEDGYVIAVHAIRGDPWLRGAAAGAAMGWKFVPTKLNGVPVKVIGNITFTFSSPDNNRSNQQNAQDSPDVLKHLEAVKTDPRSETAVLSLGKAYLAQNSFDGAVRQFGSAVSLAPNDPVAFYELGSAYMGLRDYADAIEALGQAASLKPDYLEALGTLAFAYNESGRYEEAIPVCMQALRFQPRNPDAYHGLGWAYGGLREFPEAIDAYRTELEIRPYYAGAHYGLGVMYASTHRFADARQELENAIEINPYLAIAHSHLGMVYVALRDRQAAEKELHTLRPLDPELASQLEEAIARSFPPRSQ